MAIKIVCHCGTEVISLKKQPGEVIVCRKCGNEILIPLASESETQSPKTVNGVYHAKKQDMPGKQDPKNASNPVSLPKQHDQAVSSPDKSPSFNDKETEKRTIPPIHPEKRESDKMTCPDCRKESNTGSVICIGCGYNFKTGARIENIPPIVGAKFSKKKTVPAFNSAIFIKAGKIALLLAIIVSCIVFVSLYHKNNGTLMLPVPEKKPAYSQKLTPAISANVVKNNATSSPVPVSVVPENESFCSWQIDIKNYPVKDTVGCMISGSLVFSDGKIKPVNVKLYRGMQRNGDFKLVGEHRFTGDEKSAGFPPVNVQGGMWINLKDIMQKDENCNCAYYKMEVFL
ncbi:MAG: hypothetical protein WC637_14535, partial [Victivallales bacterium]